jgi:hypothetical protein
MTRSRVSLAVVVAVTILLQSTPAGADSKHYHMTAFEAALNRSLYAATYNAFTTLFGQLAGKKGSPLAQGQVITIKAPPAGSVVPVIPSPGQAKHPLENAPLFRRLALWGGLPGVPDLRIGDVLVIHPCAGFPDGLVRRITALASMPNGILAETVPYIMAKTGPAEAPKPVPASADAQPLPDPLASATILVSGDIPQGGQP